MAFKVKNRRLLVCDCEKSMALDGEVLKRCIGGEGELQSLLKFMPDAA